MLNCQKMAKVCNSEDKKLRDFLNEKIELGATMRYKFWLLRSTFN